MSPCLYPWNLQKCCAAVWPAVPWARVSGVPLPGPPTITWGQPGRWARSVEARVGSGHQARIPPLMLAEGSPRAGACAPGGSMPAWLLLALSLWSVHREMSGLSALFLCVLPSL